MANIWKTIKYLYFTGMFLLSVSCVYLLWIWRNGMLDPVTTTAVMMDDLESLGPWAILLDVFILLIMFVFYKKSRKKPIIDNPWLSGSPNFGPLLLEADQLPVPPSPEELELMGILKE